MKRCDFKRSFASFFFFIKTSIHPFIYFNISLHVCVCVCVWMHALCAVENRAA